MIVHVCSHCRSLILAVLLLGLVAVPTGAQETLTGRLVGHAHPDDVTVVEVGDRPGHTVTLARVRGLAFLDSGEVAEVLATETIDDVQGSGTYEGYEVLTFEDGSTIVSRFEGVSTVTEDGRYIDFQGTHEYIRGTGRFAGISGEGTHEGRNHLAAGVGFYFDFELTYTLGN